MMRSIYLVLCFTFFSIAVTYSQNARVQFIHNSADTSLRYADIYWNNTLLYNNFVFHRASPFINRVGGTAATISIADSSSTSVDDAFATFDFTPVTDQKYIVLMQGIKEQSGYSSFQPFDLKIIEGAREVGVDYASVDMLFVNGSTDSGEYDILETWLVQVPFAENLSFNNYQDYLSVYAGDYRLRITDSQEQYAYGDFDAPFGQYALNGKAVTIVTSGFSNPIENSNGQLLGMWMARAEGGMMTEFTSATTSFKLIHNSSDVDLQEVDVYWNNQRVIDDLPFRHSSSIAKRRFVNDDIVIGIAPANSVSSSDVVFNYSFQPQSSDTALFVLNGLSNAQGYSYYQPLSLTQLWYPLDTALQMNDKKVVLMNGITDSSPFDLVTSDQVSLIDNTAYGTVYDFDVLNENQIWTLRNQASTYEIACYDLPIQSLANPSLLVLGSGFFHPEINNNGADYGLWVDTASYGGPLVELQRLEDQFAQVRFLNNSSDASAEAVDIYVNDEFLIGNIAFNTTSWIDVKAEADIELKVVPTGLPLTMSVYGASYHLNQTDNYFMLLDGIASTIGYNPVQDFTQHMLTNPLTEATSSTETSILFYNGSTDTGPIQFSEPLASEPFVANLFYGSYSGDYIGLDASEDIVLRLTTPSGQFVFGYYLLPLSSEELAGEAVIIFTRGFWNPANNSDGEEFSVWMLRVDGSLQELESFNYVGINDELTSAQTVLFPVPATNSLMIAVKGKVLSDGTSYTIMDMKGNNVMTGKMNGRIDVSELSSGAYCILTERGSYRFIVK